MKNAMQLKALIKKLSKEKSISAQLILQNYMLERLLERISISKYHDHFILKGGLLIAAMVGLDTRATMDMDATIKGFPISEELIKQMVLDICEIKINDYVTFSFIKIEEIREGDDYLGYRASLTANYSPMSVPLKLDFTTGDKITPKEMVYEFKLLLEDRTIKVLAYNLETVLAEKLETVVSRGDQNTRPRDFYDIFVLHKLQSNNIDYTILKAAMAATSEKRNSTEIIKRYKEIIAVIISSGAMQQRWLNYQKDFEYANDISFTEACNAVEEIMDLLTK
jgi:predicted nucleotidyltransferase component of viral defense system